MRDQFDDLEFEIEDEPLRDHRGGRARRDWSSQRVPIAIGVLALILAAATLASRNDTKHTSAPATTRVALTRPTATTLVTTPTTHAASSSTTEAPTTTTSAFSTSNLGGPLLPAKTGTRLVARTFDGLIEIDVDTGDVRKIATPLLFANDGFTFAAGPDWIVIRDGAGVDGYLARGVDVTKVPERLRHSGCCVFTGPQPNLAWVHVNGTDTAQRSSTLDLVDLASGELVQQIALDDLWPVGSDGSGGVLLEGTGGVYATDGEALHRVSTGALIASGYGTIVTNECDDSHACARVVVDVRSGGRQTAPNAGSWTLGSNGQKGVVSPDATHAAGRTYAYGSTDLAIIDLVSGQESRIESVNSDSFSNDGDPVWSSDGRYLFFVGNDRDIIGYDVTTGSMSPIASGLANIIALTARPFGA